VYNTKYNADGTVQKHKARLVVKWYTQQQGVNFDEASSSMAHFETVRVFLALVEQLSWKFDVKSAFLNGELEEEVYVTLPEGFIIGGEEGLK